MLFRRAFHKSENKLYGSLALRLFLLLAYAVPVVVEHLERSVVVRSRKAHVRTGRNDVFLAILGIYAFEYGGLLTA